MPELSLWSLIVQASLPVKIVMLLLFLASLASWVIIFRKRAVVKNATRQADAFEQKFWSGADLGALQQELKLNPTLNHGLATVFDAGFREFMRARGQRSAEGVMEAADRGMRVSLGREIDHLEEHLEFLATVGSTSPYVGLFGTVWGIMISFHALGNVSQATIAMVAPGISEALLATAMGLFAAIPAVIGFNHFAGKVAGIERRYETFKEEFSGILQRQLTHHGS